MTNNHKNEFLLSKITSKIGSGATPRGGNSVYKENGISFIRSQNIYDFHFSKGNLAFIDEQQAEKLDNVEVKKDDVLLNITGDSIARVCMVPEDILPARVNQHVSIIRSKGKIDSRYIMYYLINLKPYLLQICKVGGTRNALTKDSISNLPIRILPSHRSLSHLLSTLDAKIHLNNQVNAELEKLAKTIYNYWFVQFDFPDAQGRPYKSSGGEMVYDARLGREIPAGWGVKELSYWIADNKGGDWGKDEEQGNYTTKVNCIRGADINGLNGSGEIKSPVRFILEKNEFKILRPGELVVEISGGSPTQSTGRMAYITEEVIKRFDNPLICSNFCKALTLKSPTHLFNFAQIWNRLYDNDVFFGFEGKTSGIKNFMFDSFVNSYLSVIPSESVISSYYDIANTIEIKKQKALQQNAHLTTLRDWLLPLLMNGQVGVKD